jgi:uncharacterized membrane protein
MSDLIVIKFDSEEAAGQAMASVRSVERAGALGLTDSAVITKDASGEVQVKNEWSSGAETGAVVGGVVGALVTFFFPIAGAAVGAGAGAYIGSKFQPGVDPKFVEDVAADLQPGNSALFLMTKDQSDPTGIIAALGSVKGTVYQTTLSSDFEDSLRRSLSRGTPA